MKKAIRSIFCLLFLSFALSANAERSNRINLSFDMGLGGLSSELSGDTHGRVIIDAFFGAEYTKIFDNGFLAGGGIQTGSTGLVWFETVGSTLYSFSAIGDSFLLYPIVGKAYGKNHNSQFLLHPIKIQSVMIDTVEVKHDNDTVNKISTEDGIFVMYKTGLYYSFQWGKKLLRNGIILGGDFIWNSTGDFKKSSGLEFTLGYKLSFGF